MSNGKDGERQGKSTEGEKNRSKGSGKRGENAGRACKILMKLKLVNTQELLGDFG